MNTLASIVRIYPWLYHANMSRLSTIYTLFTIHYHLFIIICVVDTMKEDLFIIIYIYSILLYSFYFITSIYYSYDPLPIFLSRWFIVSHPWSVDQQHYLLKSLPFLLSFSYCLISFHEMEWDWIEGNLYSCYEFTHVHLQLNKDEL